MFKNCLLILALSCLLGMVPMSAAAQDNGASETQPPAGAPPHGRGHFDPARRAEMLTKQLKLTSDQQPKVLDILKSEQSQMESLHSDSSVSGDDRRAKMMEIHKSTNDQIRALLTPDQQKQFDEMQSRRGQWQGHRPEGQNSTPPPDSSN
jgi:periplasmic protein CpxP/Spy